jgi:hypothetical protein
VSAQNSTHSLLYFPYSVMDYIECKNRKWKFNRELRGV